MNQSDNGETKTPLMVLQVRSQAQAIGESIIQHLRGLTTIEEKIEELDLGDSDYHTLMTQVGRAREAVRVLNNTYQARVWRKPQGGRVPDNVQQSARRH